MKKELTKQSDKFLEFLKDSKTVNKIKKNYISYAKKNSIGGSLITGDAEDIFQDTILSCIITFDKGKHEDRYIDFEKYLYTALRYKSLNALAKVKNSKKNNRGVIFVEDICEHYKPELDYKNLFEATAEEINTVGNQGICEMEMFDNDKLLLVEGYVKENFKVADYNMYMFWSRSRKTLKEMATYSGYSQTKIMNDIRNICNELKIKFGYLYENN
jgi:DNA-directed RNA polymerase specialized sigma24 family protein